MEIQRVWAPGSAGQDLGDSPSWGVSLHRIITGTGNVPAADILTFKLALVGMVTPCHDPWGAPYGKLYEQWLLFSVLGLPGCDLALPL